MIKFSDQLNKANLLIIIFVIHLIPLFCLERSVAILNLSERVAENETSPYAGYYSLRQALEVAGVPFIATTDPFETTQYSVVIISAKLYGNTLTSPEWNALKTYVSNGGTLVLSNTESTWMNSLFGVNGFTSKNTRKTMLWDTNTNDPTLCWFDDPNEITISLAHATSATALFYTRGYTLSTGTAIANFEDGSTAIVKNQYGLGYTYLLGVEFRQIIYRNLANKDGDAQRRYGSIFEPTTDTFFLWLREVYNQSVPYAVYKHTSPANSKSSVLISHDVDWGNSYTLMNEFAAWEAKRGITAQYFMTTHYFSDNNDRDYYTSGIPYVRAIAGSQHSVGSHSVGHFHDFDNETHIPLGSRGNTRANYSPHENSSQITTGATAWGELEVSKNLLQNDCGASVNSFRAGYLAFSDYEAEVSESLNYVYNSSQSAPDVLTNFPYRMIYRNSTSALPLPVFEIPVNTSDTHYSGSPDNLNFTQAYDLYLNDWLTIFGKLRANGAPFSLLIHPTILLKLEVEKQFYSQLPWDTAVISISDYGDFWRTRLEVDPVSDLQQDTLYLTLPSDSVSKNLSWVVKNGSALSKVFVKDNDGNVLNYEISPWNTSDLLIHRGSTYWVNNSQEPELNVLNGSDIYFNQVTPGNSLTVRLDLKNEGDYPLVIYSIQSKNSNQHFTVTTAMPLIVMQGNTLTAGVKFQSNSLGSYTDTLVITTNTPDQQIQYIVLHGTASNEELPSPQNVHYVRTSSGLKLTWDPVMLNTQGISTTIKGYRVYATTEVNQSNMTFLAEVTSNEYQIPLVFLSNTTRFFRVTAYK